jgi:catechol-2,3-dioxygenase
MYASLDRIILQAQDIERLTKFYKETFELPIVEQSRTRGFVLGSHRIGKPYRKVETNSKLVLSVKHNLNEMRAGLIREGVQWMILRRIQV